MTRAHFRVGGRRGGVVKSTTSLLSDQRVPLTPVAEPEATIEEPRERLRYVRPVERAAAPSGRQTAETTTMTERLLETLATALTALAAKPAQPVALHVAPSTVELKMPDQPLSQVDVHVPETNVNVNVPEREVNVHVPEQAPPTVHVENHVPEQAAPTVHVENLVPQPDVHFAATVEAAQPAAVVVNVPEQPAPIVNVDVEVPRPRPVRVEKQANGAVRYVPEDA